MGGCPWQRKNVSYGKEEGGKSGAGTGGGQTIGDS
jgi:hypothetical protein